MLKNILRCKQYLLNTLRVSGSQPGSVEGYKFPTVKLNFFNAILKWRV